MGDDSNGDESDEEVLDKVRSRKMLEFQYKNEEEKAKTTLRTEKHFNKML